MRVYAFSLCLAATLCLGLTPPAMAASSVGSMVYGSISNSVGSASDSVQRSSNSSSPNNNVAQGEYAIVALALVPDQTDRVQLTLQAVKADAQGQQQALVLRLPKQTAADNALLAGQHINARVRPYGVEFAKTDAAPAFFLVVQDEWLREMSAHPLVL